MQYIPVDSTMIETVGYDAKACRLEVVFTSGHTYCYEGVPPEEWQALLKAPSKGAYMRAHIIGVYPDYPLRFRR